MKKTLFFVAALLLSSMAFAEMKEMTIDVTADSLQRKYGCKNSNYYLNFKLDDNISVRMDTVYTEKGEVSTNQSGVFYEANTSPADWRVYQARVDSFFLEAANGALIDSVQLTYSNKNNGTLSSQKGVNVDAAYRIASDSLLYVGGVSKICLYAASAADKVTNGQVRIQRFRIYYRADDQPSALPFVEQEMQAQKIMRDGKLYIYKDGKYINVLGM